MQVAASYRPISADAQEKRHIKKLSSMPSVPITLPLFASSSSKAFSKSKQPTKACGMGKLRMEELKSWLTVH